MSDTERAFNFNDLWVTMDIAKPIALAGILAFATVGEAQDDPEVAVMPTRAGYLLDRADSLKMEIISQDTSKENSVARRIESPLLKYQNPLYEGQSDGLLVVWTDQEVPVAFAAYSIRKDKVVFRELSTCSDLPMRCTRDGNLVWAPKPQFVRRKLDVSEDVSSNARVRLRLMKRFAERVESGQRRVLPTPLYRYQSPDQNIVDGAVFALSDTTDPEMIVLIEAVKPDDSKRGFWQYTLARMNSRPAQVHVEGELVWETKGYWKNPRARTDAYQEVLESQLPVGLRLTKAQ